MRELLRRLVLAAGLAGAIILFWTTVPALVLVAPVDFAAEMARKYPAKPGRPPLGALEMGQELIRRTTQPGSLQEYIHRVTENRLLEVAGPDWEKFFGDLQQESAGPWGARYLAAKKAFVFRWEETPLAALRPQISRMSQTWTVNYLVLKSGSQPSYLEVRSGYGFEPKNIGAPAAMVFPWRQYSWLALVAGGLGFILLGRRERPPDGINPHYPGSSLGLDVLGYLFFTLFFAIPFWVADPTQEMWSADLGVTVLSWLAATGALSLIVWSASNASLAIRLEPDGLVVTRLGGSRRLRWDEIVRVEPLLLGGIASGLILVARDGRSLRLPWHNLANFEKLTAALKTRGIPFPSEF